MVDGQSMPTIRAVATRGRGTDLVPVQRHGGGGGSRGSRRRRRGSRPRNRQPASAPAVLSSCARDPSLTIAFATHTHIYIFLKNRRQNITVIKLIIYLFINTRSKPNNSHIVASDFQQTRPYRRGFSLSQSRPLVRNMFAVGFVAALWFAGK